MAPASLRIGQRRKPLLGVFQPQQFARGEQQCPASTCANLRSSTCPRDRPRPRRPAPPPSPRESRPHLGRVRCLAGDQRAASAANESESSPRKGHVEEAGVGQVRVTIGERVAGGLEEPVQASADRAERLVALEDVQGLRDGRAAARGRPHPPHVEAAVADPGRRAAPGPYAAMSSSVIRPGRKAWSASAATGGSCAASGSRRRWGPCRSRRRRVDRSARRRGPCPGCAGRRRCHEGCRRIEVDRRGGRHVVEVVRVLGRLLEEGAVDPEAVARNATPGRSALRSEIVPKRRSA